MMTHTIKTFEAGRTYSCRSVGDHNCILTFKIVDRTAKTVRIDYHGGLSSKRIRIWGGIEQIHPLGTYSMAPVLYATDTAD